MHWSDAWHQVASHPFFAIGLTLLTYQLGVVLYERLGRFSLMQPIIVSIVLVVAALKVLGISYSHYFDSVQVIHLLLGPAIVALAVPLYENLHYIRRLLVPIMITLIVSGMVSVTLAVMVARSFGVDGSIQLSLATKSITSAIAYIVSEQIGGIPALAVAFVIITGVVGAVAGMPLLNRMGVRDPRARGLAMGFVCHAVGTARALEEGATCGAFAALGMGLMGLTTAWVLPWVVAILT